MGKQDINLSDSYDIKYDNQEVKLIKYNNKFIYEKFSFELIGPEFIIKTIYNGHNNTTVGSPSKRLYSSQSHITETSKTSVKGINAVSFHQDLGMYYNNNTSYNIPLYFVVSYGFTKTAGSPYNLNIKNDTGNSNQGTSVAEEGMTVNIILLHRYFQAVNHKWYIDTERLKNNAIPINYQLDKILIDGADPNDNYDVYAQLNHSLKKVVNEATISSDLMDQTIGAELDVYSLYENTAVNDASPAYYGDTLRLSIVTEVDEYLESYFGKITETFYPQLIVQYTDGTQETLDVFEYVDNINEPVIMDGSTYYTKRDVWEVKLTKENIPSINNNKNIKAVAFDFIVSTGFHLVKFYKHLSNQYKVLAINNKISGDIKIPSTFLGKNVTKVENNGFHSCGLITSISLPETITELGDYAIYGCSNLTTLYLCNSINKIGICGLNGNTNLKDIYYKGTKQEWNNISKGAAWSFGIKNCYVHCADGEIKIN